MKTLKYIILSMRPQHWVKNVFLFAGILFSQNLYNLVLLIKVFEGFLLFCIAASSIYILNDAMDAEKDRLHPEKKNRPLASGLLNIQSGTYNSFFHGGFMRCRRLLFEQFIWRHSHLLSRIESVLIHSRLKILSSWT